jgi:hypothetical protein
MSNYMKKLLLTLLLLPSYGALADENEFTELNKAKDCLTPSMKFEMEVAKQELFTRKMTTNGAIRCIKEIKKFLDMCDSRGYPLAECNNVIDSAIYYSTLEARRKYD